MEVVIMEQRQTLMDLLVELKNFCIDQKFEPDVAGRIAEDAKRIFEEKGTYMLSYPIDPPLFAEILLRDTVRSEYGDMTAPVVRLQRDYARGICGDQIFQEVYTGMIQDGANYRPK